MKTPLIIPAVIVVLLIGCRPEENPEQLKAVNQSLEYANGVMQDENNLVYVYLREKEKDPATAYSAKIWRPKANQIKLYADSIKALLKIIRSDLITQSDNFKKEYVTIVKQLNDANGVGMQLFNKLAVFNNSFVAMLCYGEDSIMKSNITKNLHHILRTLPMLSGYGDSMTDGQQGNYKVKWLEKNFGGSSSFMAMIMLNKIEGDVLAAEREFIEYCNSKVVDNTFTYDKFSAIAVSSSSYVKAGQPIEVSAGVGAFTDDAQARITINGKDVRLNTEGIAEYKFVATGKPGKYTIPVTIECYNFFGEKVQIRKNIKYVIAEN